MKIEKKKKKKNYFTYRYEINSCARKPATYQLDSPYNTYQCPGGTRLRLKSCATNCANGANIYRCVSYAQCEIEPTPRIMRPTRCQLRQSV